MKATCHETWRGTVREFASERFPAVDTSPAAMRQLRQLSHHHHVVLEQGAQNPGLSINMPAGDRFSESLLPRPLTPVKEGTSRLQFVPSGAPPLR